MRTVKAVRILPLHGQAVEWSNINDITFIKNYKEEGPQLPIVRYEVQVTYMNDDKFLAILELNQTPSSF